MRREILERNILFLCDDNACLSQIAEATAKHLAPPKTRIFSAGAKPTRVPDYVIESMRELGISMHGQQSKGLADVPVQDIDLVVTYKECAEIPRRAKIETWQISEQLKADKSGAQDLEALRSRRDEIGNRGHRSADRGTP